MGMTIIKWLTLENELTKRDKQKTNKSSTRILNQFSKRIYHMIDCLIQYTLDITHEIKC